MTDPVRRRIRKALNAAFVRTVTEPGKYGDGHGLMLRVRPGGEKAWIQRLVIQGRRRELGLGSVELVSLAEARSMALENRKMARAGGDPLQSRREARAVLTFEQASREVHRLHEPTWKNKKHAAQFISTLETYAFPAIGNMRVPDITPADVLRVLSPIWNEKPETARRVRQRVGTVMKWGIAQGWRTDNPAENIGQALPKQDTIKQARKALPYSEVHGCIAAIRDSKAGISTKLALETLILTACRSGEIRNAVWSEVNLEAAVWEIPAERMKMKRGHRIPLSPRAVELLSEAANLTGGTGIVFPGARAGRPMSDMTMSKLVKGLGFDADVHGFRTSFRTWAQERTNYPREVAEFALAHVVGNAAERAYARSDLFEKRRKMMNAWADFILETPAEIVRIG